MSSPIHPTTLIEAPRLAASLKLGGLLLASETYQVTGSFKFRAAYNLASRVPNDLILAASSGNFGQALACACRMVGKRCIIVMPHSSAGVKIDAVRYYGGEVELIDTRRISRQAKVDELARLHPNAYIASAYDDAYVIEGNASLGRELSCLTTRPDVVLAAIGGGGHAAGIIVGLKEGGSDATVVGAEPLLANDAARSLAAGHIVRNDEEPQTIADGARTISLGKLNWPILKEGLAAIVEVPEVRIAQAVRALFTDANLKAEPTGALTLGALLTAPARFEGKIVCCVVSGGNVDPDTYARILCGS